ncbi:hypothetical protein ABZ172_29615, partial [Streptomyces sp. NPDC006296]|uniref:hypothetical protein n=1 Tax=Streptomyces sp. NPDC006296 TaxID=3156746 RepID=UPI0033A92D6E
VFVIGAEKIVDLVARVAAAPAGTGRAPRGPARRWCRRTSGIEREQAAALALACLGFAAHHPAVHVLAASRRALAPEARCGAAAGHGPMRAPRPSPRASGSPAS